MITFFPDDDNGNVLRNMQLNGDNLNLPRDVDFSVVFPNAASCASFIRVVTSEDLHAKAEPPGVMGEACDVTVTCHMVPSYEAIGSMEKRLEDLAMPFGGWNDGWGCFSA